MSKDEIRILIADAIGGVMKSAVNFPLHTKYGAETLRRMADAAIAECEGPAMRGEPLRISDSDLRHVMRFHRESVDIEWGAGAHIEGVTFVDSINISNFDPLNEVVTEFKAGATYWTGDGPRATPAAGAHPMMAGIHKFPAPDAA